MTVAMVVSGRVGGGFSNSRDGGFRQWRRQWFLVEKDGVIKSEKWLGGMVIGKDMVILFFF